MRRSALKKTCIATGMRTTRPLIGIAALWSLAALAQAQKPQATMVEVVQAKLTIARKALDSTKATLDGGQRQQLATALRNAEEAVTRYAQLAKQGEARQAAMAPLAIAGAGVAADDATGIGVGDDVLLPFIGLAMLVTYCRTQSPATGSELAAAWQNVAARLDALARVVDEIRSARWTCTAQCNVQAIPGRAPPTFPERVTGTGSSSSEVGACENAKRAATQSAPAGTYPRHCKCDCGKH